MRRNFLSVLARFVSLAFQQGTIIATLGFDDPLDLRVHQNLIDKRSAMRQVGPNSCRPPLTKVNTQYSRDFAVREPGLEAVLDDRT